MPITLWGRTKRVVKNNVGNRQESNRLKVVYIGKCHQMDCAHLLAGT